MTGSHQENCNTENYSPKKAYFLGVQELLGGGDCGWKFVGGLERVQDEC